MRYKRPNRHNYWLFKLNFILFLLIEILTISLIIFKKRGSIQMINYCGYFVPNPIEYKNSSITCFYPPQAIYLRKRFRNYRKSLYPDLFKTGFMLNFTQKRVIRRANSVEYSYIIMKNVFVNCYSTFGTKKQFVWPHQSTRHFSRRRFFKTKGNVICHCNHLIDLGHQLAISHFGHCHHDIFLPLMLIPKDIREKSYIMCISNFSLMKDGFTVIGFDREHIIDVTDDDWVFAHHYHTITRPLPFLTYFGICCVRFREILDLRFNISSIRDTRYVFCNRIPGKSRHISNMHDVYLSAKRVFPEILWEELQDIFPTIEETAKNWAAIKLIFLPTGSNCVKCLAMKPGSVMVIIMADVFDTAAIRTAIACDIFNLWFILPKMIHFDETNMTNIIDVSTALDYLEIGIYVSIHKSWPVSDIPLY